MVTSPNQKTITINKTDVEKGTGKKRAYFIAYTDIIEAAAQDLTNTAFKLYMYFVTNSNGYISAFSPKDVSERYGCSMDAARDAFKLLETKGYLTLEPGSRSKYLFNDIKDTIPAELPLDIAAHLEKRTFKDTTTGEVYELTFADLLKSAQGNEELAQKVWNTGGRR